MRLPIRYGDSIIVIQSREMEREEEPHTYRRARISSKANREIRFYRYVGIKSRGEAFYLLAMVIAARTAT